MDEAPSQAMLIAAATGLAAGIEAGDGLALHVDNLSPAVDPETTIGIVPDRIERRRIERRFFDSIHGRIGPAPELRIAALIHIGVPPGHGFYKVRERNALELVALFDLRG